MNTAIQWIVQGMAVGLVYALFGVGYSLMFGVMRCLNIAHAGTFVLSALAACGISRWAGSSVFALPAVLLGSIALGIAVNLAVHQLALRPLLRPSRAKIDIEMASFLATLGAFFVLQTIAIEVTDGKAVALDLAAARLGAVRIAGANLPAKYLVAGAMALICLALVMWLLATPIGRRLRATADNRMLASVLGIDVEKTQRFAMALTGGLAGLGGATIAYLYGQASFGLSESYLVKAIVIGIVAGLGSVGGAAWVAVGLGIIETVTIGTVGSSYRDIASFVILISVLAIRPQGIFARRQRLAT